MATPAWIRPDGSDPGGGGPVCLVMVKVVPGASRERVVGPLGDRLKVAVSAPAEGGKANRAVLRLIGARAGVGRGAVSLVSGGASPEKTLRVAGVGAAELAARLVS